MAAGWLLAAIGLAVYLHGTLPLLGSTTFDAPTCSFDTPSTSWRGAASPGMPLIV